MDNNNQNSQEELQRVYQEMYGEPPKEEPVSNLGSYLKGGLYALLFKPLFIFCFFGGIAFAISGNELGFNICLYGFLAYLLWGVIQFIKFLIKISKQDKLGRIAAIMVVLVFVGFFLYLMFY